MTPMNKTQCDARQSPSNYSLVMVLVLTALLLMTSNGCAHYRVISSDRQVIPLTTGRQFTPSCNGMFVPDATWLEMRQAISDKIETLEKQNTK